MSQVFKIFDDGGNEVLFNHDEATDGGTTTPVYSIEMAQKVTAGNEIKQQIRPGKRYVKSYKMNLPQVKYLAFMNLLTNDSDDFFIQYTTAPTLLTNDTEVSQTNDFEVGITLGIVEDTVSDDDIVYVFPMTINSVRTL